ncbi:hypothetical protein [Thiomicrorhabdus indica]|uniref:hypothetical protein n=1 Tax=Thiomicrorhabdus indica TaxID=2267253 RepID=UPI00102E0295|nr:hypothetical protein [Thiomicrorhabdus indica]
MNSINPSLASAVQSMQSPSQVNPAVQPQSAEVQTSTPSSASTTVTLSSGQPQTMVDYSGLNNQQTVRNSTQVEQTAIDGNQVSSGTTYATNLQNQSSYFLTQQAETPSNMSGNTTENLANQNANIASE